MLRDEDQLQLLSDKDADFVVLCSNNLEGGDYL